MMLISGGSDRTAKIWKTATHELLHTLANHPGPVRHVALSAKGKFAATASSDNDVRLHDLTAGNAKMVNADGPAVAVQFLGDESLLTAAGKHVYWWDIREVPGACLQSLDGDQFARITGFAGTADGLLFAIAGDPRPGTQRPEDVGFSRVVAVSRHHADTEFERLHDTGVGVSRVVLSRPTGGSFPSSAATGWCAPGNGPVLGPSPQVCFP